MFKNVGTKSEIELFANSLRCEIPKSVHNLAEMPFAIIGSGLSFSTANFLSAFLDFYSVRNRVYTPLEYCFNTPLSIPILLTYRGKNHDIESVAQLIIRKGIKDCVILSGTINYPIASLLEKNGVTVHKIVLPVHSEERRFVSFRATMSMISMSYNFALSFNNNNKKIELPDARKLWDISQYTENQARTNASKLIELDNFRNKKWIVVGKGFLDPFSVMMQSVFAESGLASIQIADYKDYTHGKYLSAFQEKNIIYFLLDYAVLSNIVQIMHERFSPIFTVFKIPVNGDEFINYFESALTIFYFAAALLEAQNDSFKAPPKPKEMRYWTSWGKIK